VLLFIGKPMPKFEPLPEAVQHPKYPNAVRHCCEKDEDNVYGVNVHFFLSFVNDLLCKNIGGACLGCKRCPWNQIIHILEFLTLYNLISAVMPWLRFFVARIVHFPCG